MANFRTKVIVNPASANGSTGRRWEEISRAMEKALGSFDAEMTGASGEATALTRQALKDGYEMIVSVGGDGTNNEVVNGFFENRRAINPDAVLATIPRGTGGDFRKTTGTPKNFVQAAAWLSGRNTRIIDLGFMTLVNHQGRRDERYFINIASFGIGGEIDQRVNRSTKVFGGAASFAYAAIASVRSYSCKEVRLTIDGKSLGTQKIFNVAVCNGRFFGGGMRIAPKARIDDGLFDIVVVGDLNLFETIAGMPLIYVGGHLRLRKFTLFRGREVEAVSEDTVLHDVDGEAPGRLPSTYQILPSAIRLKVMG